jgi:hypothetical protein
VDDDAPALETGSGPLGPTRLTGQCALSRGLSNLSRGSVRMSSQEVDAMQESFRKRKAKQGTVEKGLFPEQKGAKFPVLDPDSDARFSWDCYLMVLIFYVMLVTPFQLSFTNAPTHPRDTFTLGSPSGYNKYIGLWVSNLFVDIAFVGDLVLAFNTGFFDHNEGEWVVSRNRIARGAGVRCLGGGRGRRWTPAALF